MNGRFDNLESANAAGDNRESANAAIEYNRESATESVCRRGMVRASDAMANVDMAVAIVFGNCSGAVDLDDVLTIL